MLIPVLNIGSDFQMPELQHAQSVACQLDNHVPLHKASKQVSSQKEIDNPPNFQSKFGLIDLNEVF